MDLTAFSQQFTLALWKAQRTTELYNVFYTNVIEESAKGHASTNAPLQRLEHGLALLNITEAAIASTFTKPQ